MINHEALSNLISYCIKAHAEHPTKPSKAFRKWDEKTPYATHPIWCAMTLLSETSLDETFRMCGAQVLLLHDLIEDTTAPLPKLFGHWVYQDSIKVMVKEMTFDSSEQEMREIWSKGPAVKLLKLYDKVSNLMDGVWMSPEKRATYKKYVKKLAKEVQKTYGDLNIVRIAKVFT